MKNFMKPALFLGLMIFGSSIMGFTQIRPYHSQGKHEAKLMQVSIPSKTDDGIGSKPANVYTSNRSVLDDPSTMMTKYDLQTNSSNQNRIYQFADGKLAATSQWSHLDGGWSDRGTGYNFFDGSAWGTLPAARIEDEKTGWPSIAPLGPNGEIVVSHTMNDGLKVCTRPTKG